MRGEICIGSATVLSLAAVLILIFAHVGQINTSNVPRGIAMAKVNVSLYGAGLENAFTDPIYGLYTDNASSPLGVGAGLRQLYDFAYRYKPYDVITSDMASNYSQFTDAIIPTGTAFRDDAYLSASSKAAYYMILLGTICAFLALVTGVPKHTVFFLMSTSMALFGSILLLIGAAIWTALIQKTKSVNAFTVGTVPTPSPLGIEVSMGSGLYLVWAAWACLFVSVIPYMISCCTYRG